MDEKADIVKFTPADQTLPGRNAASRGAASRGASPPPARSRSRTGPPLALDSESVRYLFSGMSGMSTSLALAL